MKLNLEGRKELRKLVERNLKNVPVGMKISFDNELIDKLLFEELTYERNGKKTVKLPVWSGQFLEKIDLSEVSFENESWGMLGRREECLYSYIYEKNKRDNQNFYLEDNEMINYNHNNAQIDFSKSWETKNNNKICIRNCNFCGTYLCNNNPDNLYYVENSNLGNTNIKIRNIYSTFSRTNLNDVDLNNFTLGIQAFLNGLYFKNCSLRFSKLNITIGVPKEINKRDKEKLHDIIEQQMIDGCYINDIRIKTVQKKYQCL